MKWLGWALVAFSLTIWLPALLKLPILGVILGVIFTILAVIGTLAIKE